MTYNYKIEMSFDAGKTDPGAFIGRINDFMGKCGFDEKVVLRHEGLGMNMAASRPLAPFELYKISKIILDSFNEQLDWGWKIEAFYLLPVPQ